VRTLRPIIEHHPVIVASKSVAAVRDGSRWRAELRVEAADRGKAGAMLPIILHARNTGAAAWRPSTRSGIGHVTCGVQLLDRSMRLVGRDHHRVPLPRAIEPGATLTLTFGCPMPAEAGQYGLKFDLVAEGITWFETSGSLAHVRVITVEP
jgi:hypothetical protein